MMGEAQLVNRTKFVSSLKNELVPLFNQLSADTRVPKSRLLDEAIEDLLKKYEKRRRSTERPPFFHSDLRLIGLECLQGLLVLLALLLNGPA